MKVINGLCVSKGNATGSAVIVGGEKAQMNLTTSKRILVMKQLDRALLVNLDENVVGVIAEVGNIGSHGAGILRQLGIPCVLRIKDATTLIKDRENIEICGNRNCIICSNSSLLHDNKYEKKFGELYKSIAKKDFSVNMINTIEEWTCGRPERSYQRLRFDIMNEAFSKGANYLYGLPLCDIKQNEYGAIITYGAPCIEDICSFVLANPEWLVEKAKERSRVFGEIKKKLKELYVVLDEDNPEKVLSVFNIAIDLYRELFKYTHMSQSISDEILDIYLDFCDYICNERKVDDILRLRSVYVENCLKEGVDPGVSQIWKKQKVQPHIWDGNLSMETLPENEDIIKNIHKGFKNDSVQLLRDYKSFRTIVPLVYELSEEFFYVSSSINSFINWAIQKLCCCVTSSTGMFFSPEDAYVLSLDEFRELVNEHVEKWKEKSYEQSGIYECI